MLCAICRSADRAAQSSNRQFGHRSIYHGRCTIFESLDWGTGIRGLRGMATLPKVTRSY